MDGDHNIREESVDVDKSVGSAAFGEEGLHRREVTPASCPMSRASNVIENCWELDKGESDKMPESKARGVLPSSCRFHG